MTEAAAIRPGLAACCRLCCRPIASERRCPAFALAGIAAHAGCCGGCASGPDGAVPAAGRSEAAA
jgi:hypothetical protein